MLFHIYQIILRALPWSVQNLTIIEQLKQMLQMNEISQDVSLKWDLEEYPIT